MNLTSQTKKEALKYTLLFLCSCITFCLNSCKPSASIYNADYPLTDKYAYAVSGGLKVHIPEGWFASEAKSIGIWLIRNDFSATLNFVELNSDSLRSLNLLTDSKKAVSSALEFSKRQKIRFLKDRFIIVPSEDPEIFYINNMPFGTYIYKGDEKLPVRIVVFEYGKIFYELSAMPASDTGKKEVDTNELFRIQQTLIGNISQE